MKIDRVCKYYLINFIYNTLALVLFIRNSFKKKKVIVLYLYADTNNYPNTFRKLNKILNGMLFVDFFIVKIDNFNENKEVRRIEKNTIDIGGDNRYWEFSGWKVGLSFLNKRRMKGDHILFVNDAFLNFSYLGYDSYFYKKKFNSYAIYKNKNSAMGVIDRHEKSEKIKGIDVSSWIRSNFYLIPYKHAMKIDFVYLKEEIDQILPKNYNGDIFNRTNIINYNLKKFLELWMTKEWQFAEQINQDNWPIIRKKLVSILNERMLTVQIRKFNIKIVNFNVLLPNAI